MGRSKCIKALVRLSKNKRRLGRPNMVMRIISKRMFWSEMLSRFISLSVGFGDELASTWKRLLFKIYEFVSYFHLCN